MVDITREQPITVAEACELLRCSDGTVRKFFKIGLEKFRIGPKRLYTTVAAIDRFKNRCNEPQALAVSDSRMAEAQLAIQSSRIRRESRRHGTDVEALQTSRQVPVG